MGNVLYVANFDPDQPEDELRDLFTQFGEVSAVSLEVEAKTGRVYALVQMVTEKIATKAYNGLNGFALHDHRLAVSYPEVDESRELTAKNRKVIEDIVHTLEETDDTPLRQIESIVRLCGATFAQAILDEVLEIEAGEGLMTSEGTQRRTKGGVFFYLCRYRMSQPVRRIVYNRKGKMPEAE